jgi:uncharacterized protein DUF4136
MTKWPAIVAGLLLITSGAALAQKVNVDSDARANFAQYRTYMWTAGTPSPNPLGQQRIEEAVNGQLAAKGLTRVTEDPDVFVATHMTTQNQKELVVDGFGGGPFWGGGYGTAKVKNYTQGTLVVDLYDGHTKQLVWRGSGTDTASDKADKNTEMIQKAVAKMFAHYPPQPR